MSGNLTDYSEKVLFIFILQHHFLPQGGRAPPWDQIFFKENIPFLH